MRFFTFIAAVLVATVPATAFLVGYEGLHCKGEPNVHAECRSNDSECHSFANSSSFRAAEVTRPPPVCVKMWTGPDCTGTPYLYTEEFLECRAVTFPAASFSCGRGVCDD